MNPEPLATLRNRATPMLEFRRAALALAEQLAQEVGRVERVVLVPILRSGLAMLPAFLQRFPAAPVGFLGMRRDETTLQPHLYYENLPTLGESDHVLLLDPMLATGGSARLAVQRLLASGAREEQVRLVALIGAKPGVRALHEQYPNVSLTVAVVDEKLDAHGFIVPGLGDFGDRFFGTA